MTTRDPVLTEPADDTGAFQVMIDGIPSDEKYNPIRFAIQRIQETFPDELAEITQSRIDGWIAEVDRGDGRTADDIRDDIFRVVVGRQTIMDVLGVTAEQADDLIKGGNDGGINFSDLDIASAPGGGSVVAPPGDPSGIMSGGRLVSLVDDDGNETYAMVYSVGDVDHVYTFDSWKEVVAVLGSNTRVTGDLDYESILDPATDQFIVGSALALTVDPDISYAVYFDNLAAEAALEAGVRDPNRLSRIYEDKRVQQLLALAAEGDWHPDRLQAEIRDTDAYHAAYPGIDKILAKGSADPEAEWRQYYNSVEESLRALGYDPDEFGSYDSRVGEMLDKGITADEFNTMAPTFVRARQSPEFAAALNQWVQRDLGSELTFEDWFDILEGTTTPEMDAVVERATLQFQADLATTSLSADQISRLAELTQLSEQQMTLAFSTAEEALLSVGDTDLERYGLSQQQLVNAAFGVDTDGVSATDINRRARKAATELGIQDDAKTGFFLGFDRLSRPVRQGLTAVNPERG